LIDRDWTERILAYLNSTDQRVFLAPELADRSFLTIHGGSDGYWARFLPDVRTLWQVASTDEVAALLPEIAGESSQLLTAGADFVGLSPVLNSDLQNLIADALDTFQASDLHYWGLCPAGSSMLMGILAQGVETLRVDGIAHTDLHPGNVVDSRGTRWIIDLENCRPAPAFTDLLYVATWARHAPGSWESVRTIMAESIGRDIAIDDVAACAAVMVLQASQTDRAGRGDLISGLCWMLHQVAATLDPFNLNPALQVCRRIHRL
jgi:Ser/Thr protein kinase RdoA (MazF antagonist)